MTNKVYKSAMGRAVDLGALILENENVRAVGNMNVNSRGDVVDSSNQVIDPKNRSVQRQYKKQTVNTSELLSRAPEENKKTQAKSSKVKKSVEEPVAEEPVVEETLAEEPVVEETLAEPVEATQPVPRGGLAAAIARSQAVKQELMKTPRQLAQEQAGVKKI
jgi:flagellar biosynthesis GTPase FlhF